MSCLFADKYLLAYPKSNVMTVYIYIYKKNYSCIYLSQFKRGFRHGAHAANGDGEKNNYQNAL